MNLVTGSTITCYMQGGNGFKAEIVNNYYKNDKHKFVLKYLELYGFDKNPKKTWGGRELYNIVACVEQPANYEEANASKRRAKSADLFLEAKAIKREMEEEKAAELAKTWKDRHIAEIEETHAKMVELGGEGTTLEVIGYEVRFSHTERKEIHTTAREAFLSALKNLCKDYCNSVVIRYLERKVIKYYNYVVERETLEDRVVTLSEVSVSHRY